MAAGVMGLLVVKPKVMCWITVLLAILVTAAVPVTSVLTNETDDGDATGPANHSVLSVWPRPKGPHRMIWFRHSTSVPERHGWEPLTNELKQLVAAYDSALIQTSANVIMCEDELPPPGKVCFFDIRAVAPNCTASDNFGYSRGQPCVFIQFSNVTGWDPEPLASDEASQMLPAMLLPRLNPRQLLLHCDGETPADRENIGEVLYSPYQGFRTTFFPFTGERDYMPPLVAVQFRHPTRGIAISVRCRLWTRNPPPANASSVVYFNLLVD